VVEAVETTDRCIGRVVDRVTALGGVCLVTADHGNAEQLLEAFAGAGCNVIIHGKDEDHGMKEVADNHSCKSSTTMRFLSIIEIQQRTTASSMKKDDRHAFDRPASSRRSTERHDSLPKGGTAELGGPPLSSATRVRSTEATQCD
jgi:hypothetical protein